MNPLVLLMLTMPLGQAVKLSHGRVWEREGHGDPLQEL